MYDVTIIGAGIVGASVARELSKYNLKVLILEKDNDVANGTTKANSAIVHAGYDPKPHSLKARFNVEGNRIYEKLCQELDIPFKRIGSLVVAFNKEEMETVRRLYKRGQVNGVPQLRLLNREELRDMEPNLSEQAVGALYAPTSAITGPFELTIAMVENAMENGVDLLLNSRVIDIKKMEEGFLIHTLDRQIRTRYVVNCAGVYADEIHRMVASPTFKITPRRGEYFLLDKTAGNLVRQVVFQCPTKVSKGVVVLPTIHGNLLVGPNAEDIEDKEDRDTSKAGLDYIWEASQKTSKEIPFDQVITTFAGLRASPDTGDFIIGEVEGAKGFINAAGIESPGLTAAPAIGRYIKELLKDIDGNFKEKPDFNPIRRRQINFMELSQEKKSELIKKDPRYGRIICRCENITEGEIVDVIHRKAGATTVDGVKKRARAGMGRCQGGFCQPRVMEILSRELEKDFTEILKDAPGSNIAIGETK